MTTEIEKTKRALYGCLDRIRRAAKHRALTAEFEERLEEHLEALRRESEVQQAKRQDALDSGSAALDRLRQMTEERDQIQGRLHAIDHAYCEQSNRAGAQAREIERLNELNRIAGEELIRVQGIARGYLDDMRTAEKLSDEFSEKLRDAKAVIGHQEQLIVGQRLAIGEMHMVVRSAKSAVATLKRLGYTDCGGQLWKPPLGKKPHFDDWCTDPRCAHCRARAGGPGTYSAAIVSNGAGYPGSGAGSVKCDSGAGVRPGVGAGGSGCGGGAGGATRR